MHSPPASRRSADWRVVVAAAAVVLLAQLPGTHATAWHFFDDAAQLLAGGGDGTGLHLYAAHPEFQFGPLSILAALPFTVFGERAGSWIAMVVGSAAGVLAFWFLLRTVLTLGARPSRLTATIAGVLFVVVWGDVAVRTAHIDDALALAATAAAVWACASGRAVPTAVLLGVAAAAKPWAIAFAPLALAVPGPRPAARLLLVAAVPVLTWAPFVLAEPATLDVTEFRIDVDPTSTLRALGVDTAETPGWARPAQLLGGLALATWSVRRGRWHAVVLAAVAWRLLLEPGAHRYYTAGAVLGALLIELTADAARGRGRRRVALPWRSAALAATLELTALPGAPELVARTARLGAVLAALAAVATAAAVNPVCARSPGRAPASSSASAP